MILVVLDKILSLSGEEQKQAASTFVILGGILGMSGDLKRRLDTVMPINLMENEVFGPMIRKSRQEGMAGILQKLLEKRFGPIPEWAQTQIATATEENIEAWAITLDESSSIEKLLA